MGLDPSRAKQKTEENNCCGSHISPGSPLQHTLSTSAKHLPAHPELPYQSHCVEEDPSKGGQLVQDPQVLQLGLGCGDLTKHITRVITPSRREKKRKKLAQTRELPSRGAQRGTWAVLAASLGASHGVEGVSAPLLSWADAGR